MLINRWIRIYTLMQVKQFIHTQLNSKIDEIHKDFQENDGVSDTGYSDLAIMQEKMMKVECMKSTINVGFNNNN